MDTDRTWAGGPLGTEERTEQWQPHKAESGVLQESPGGRPLRASRSQQASWTCDYKQKSQMSGASFWGNMPDRNSSSEKSPKLGQNRVCSTPAGQGESRREE